MELLFKWLLFTSVQVAATLSPGPAFALTVRGSMAYDRRAGLLTSVGLGLGVGVYVLLVLGGISVVLARSALLYSVVKYSGAAYLVFIGIRALRAQKRILDQDHCQSDAPAKTLSPLQAVRMGFLTNLLNPKALVFFTAVFTQFIDPLSPPPVLALYGMTSIIVEIGWFCLLTLFLTEPTIKKRFIGIAHWVERACGGLLLALGVRLAFSKMG